MPDNWKKVQDVSIKAGFSKTNSKESYATYQTISNTEWRKLEESGVAFLPAAGYLTNKFLIDEQYFGQYWSSTDLDQKAFTLTFYSEGCYLIDHLKNNRRSVRLVKDCK